MSSHFGWVARRRWANAITRFYYDDISLLNSICSRSILFRSRFNVQHRRFVETMCNECQIFISNLASEKKMYSLRSTRVFLKFCKIRKYIAKYRDFILEKSDKNEEIQGASLDILRTKFFEVEIPSNCS